MTAIALSYCAPPSSGPWEEGFLNRPRVEIVANPWTNSAISSGAFYSASFEVSPETGVTRWLGDLLSASEETLCPLTTPEVPAALAAIREAFSLNVAQMAQIFGVSRQAVYDWREGKPVKLENRQRIATIRALAHRWNDLHPKPVGRIVAEQIDGVSLLSLLSAEQVDPSAVERLFRTIAARLAAAEANRPPSARELIEKHGMQPLPEAEVRRNMRAAFLAGRRGR